MNAKPPVPESLWNQIPEAARSEIASVIAKKDIWISTLAEAVFDSPEASPKPTFVNPDEELHPRKTRTLYDSKGRIAQIAGNHGPVFSMYYGDEEETTYNAANQEVPLAATIAGREPHGQDEPIVVDQDE